MTRPSPSTMARDCTSISSLTSMAPRGLVGSVRAVRRINQYICVSVSHEPNESVPNGSVWRASMSPAGGYFGGRRWQACGSRRAKEAAITHAICKSCSIVSSVARTVEYRLLRWGAARANSTSGKDAGRGCIPWRATSLAVG
jgi:hypothetical protein